MPAAESIGSEHACRAAGWVGWGHGWNQCATGANCTIRATGRITFCLVFVAAGARPGYDARCDEPPPSDSRIEAPTHVGDQGGVPPLRRGIEIGPAAPRGEDGEVPEVRRAVRGGGRRR